MMTATKRGQYGTLTVTYEAHPNIGPDTALLAAIEHRDQLLETAQMAADLVETLSKFLKVPG